MKSRRGDRGMLVGGELRENAGMMQNLMMV